MIKGKISVIMPIHNTPIYYLKEAICDVLNQTVTNFELICVDDASTNTAVLQVLNMFKSKNPERMSVVALKEAKGAANARNIGLNICDGEYIIFLDSDDRFDKTLLEKMLIKIKYNDDDVCICNYVKVYNDETEEFFVGFYLDQSREDWLAGLPTNPWTRLVRKSYLIENDIKFQELSSCNDVYYAVMTSMCTEKICFLENEYLVKYRADSIGAITRSRNPINLWYAYKAINQRLDDLMIFDYRRKWVEASLISSSLFELRIASDGEKKRKFLQNIQDYYKDKRFNSKKLERYRILIVENEYDSRWFEHKDDYDYWLNRNTSYLLKKIGIQKVCLLGIGKRGKSFLKWAHDNGIEVIAISDLALSDEEQLFGIDVCSRESILSKEDILIVASNDSVYSDVRGKTANPLINLEDYCPI